MIERTYQLKQATITIKDRKVPSKLVVSPEVHREMLKRLRELRAANQHQGSEFRSLQLEVHEYRYRMRKHKATYYTLIVQLTHPRFRGFKMDFSLNLQKDEETFAQQVRNYVRQTIRLYRADQRSGTRIASLGSNKQYSMLMFWDGRNGSRVFKHDGEILRLYVHKNMKTLYADKKPEAKIKYVGIELEFCASMPEERLALTLFRAGLQKFVQLKKDGSLRPREGENGFELALLLPENTYKKQLRKVLDILKSVKAVAKDRRCGLHVHLDMRQRNKERVFSNLVSCQQVLLRLVDPSRRDNEFCQMVASKKMPINFKGTRQERYKTINAAAYYKYRTLEVRMHEGSIDYGQITGWIDLLIKIANHRKLLTRSIFKLTIFRKRFNLNKKIYQYAVDRNCYWQLNNGGLSEPRNTTRSFGEDISRSVTAAANRMSSLRMVEIGDAQPATERQGA